jgi:hypothetical protein
MKPPIKPRFETKFFAAYYRVTLSSVVQIAATMGAQRDLSTAHPHHSFCYLVIHSVEITFEPLIQLVKPKGTYKSGCLCKAMKKSSD